MTSKHNLCHAAVRILRNSIIQNRSRIWTQVRCIPIEKYDIWARVANRRRWRWWRWRWRWRHIDWWWRWRSHFDWRRCTTEVINQAAHDAVRTEACINCAAKTINQVDLARIEETILQANIPAFAQWRANAGKCLPCETGVGIVKESWSCQYSLHVNACNTGAAANKALNAVILTEIQHSIDHEAQCACVTSNAV